MLDTNHTKVTGTFSLSYHFSSWILNNVLLNICKWLLVIDDIAKNTDAGGIFDSEVALPHSLLISNFDSPVYATNYSLEISRNIVYRIQGIDVVVVVVVVVVFENTLHLHLQQSQHRIIKQKLPSVQLILDASPPFKEVKVVPSLRASKSPTGAHETLQLLPVDVRERRFSKRLRKLCERERAAPRALYRGTERGTDLRETNIWTRHFERRFGRQSRRRAELPQRSLSLAGGLVGREGQLVLRGKRHQRQTYSHSRSLLPGRRGSRYNCKTSVNSRFFFLQMS